ncbi:hypothetical protein [Actinomadura sp. NPDC049753]|uniref:hypothetical protein n=1 Tax=Actinomadura sp. NPDC049753 TaxID=3154739 RepID=UPI00343BB54B
MKSDGGESAGSPMALGRQAPVIRTVFNASPASWGWPIGGAEELAEHVVEQMTEGGRAIAGGCRIVRVFMLKE